jgi:hypothetical protein
VPPAATEPPVPVEVVPPEPPAPVTVVVAIDVAVGVDGSSTLLSQAAKIPEINNDETKNTTDFISYFPFFENKESNSFVGCGKSTL